jgi:hypothetical protein
VLIRILIYALIFCPWSLALNSFSQADQVAPLSNASALEEALEKERTEPHLPATFNFSSQTTFRAFERTTTEDEDATVLPLFEYMQLDYEEPEQGGWSVHGYGWIRADLADSAYFEEHSDGELLYGYLAYAKPYSAFQLALGRKQIFAGVTNATVDGLQLDMGLDGVLTAMLFGGVTDVSDDAGSDTTYGGRLAFHPRPAYELALSYRTIDVESGSDEKVGIDLSMNWSDWLTFHGLSGFNTESKDWHEHNYSAALRYNNFSFEPAYQYFSYRDYFGNGAEASHLFQFLEQSDEQVTIAGADIQYEGSAALRLAGRYRQYTYTLRQETADYYAALASVDLPGSSQLGGETGRMAGETDANIYTLYRVYFYWFNPFKWKRSAFISGDAIFQAYDAPVFGRDNATNYSLSTGARFFRDVLEVKLTGAYSQDPYFDENLEALLTIQINNEAGNP